MAVVIIGQLMFDVYAGVRVYTSYRNTAQLAILRTEFDEHVKTQRATDKSLQEWIKALDAAIYAPIPEKPVAPALRKPTAVELWQLNRDKELRERIQRLEQWRLRMDR
jgi:hypothetical protein